MSKADEAIANVACKLWRLFNDQEWDQARGLLSGEFEGYWPQTKEQIFGCDNFIELHRREHGAKRIQIQNHQFTYDVWDKEYDVALQVLIEDGNQVRRYALSFLTVDREHQITKATEYWADCFNAPESRKGLVELFGKAP